MSKIISLTILLCVLFSCSGPSRPQKRLSLPDWRPLEVDSPLSSLVIAATFNLDGAIGASKEEIHYQDGDKLTFEVAGLDSIKGHINILKKRYPQNLILVDTGHLFGPLGSVKESSSSAQISLTNFYQELRYDGVLFTDRELKYEKNSNWSKTLSESSIPFINSNIISLKEGNAYTPEGVERERVIEINGLKVGILGLTIIDRKANGKSVLETGFAFEDEVLSFLKSRKELEDKKIDALIVLAQLPHHCQNKKVPSSLSMEKSHRYQIQCPKDDLLLQFLKRLPPDSVDAMVIGGGEKILHGFYKKIPIVSAPGHGHFLSLIEIVFDSKTKSLLTSQGVIYPPVKICHQFVLATHDCYRGEFDEVLPKIDDHRGSDMALIPSKFLGHEVEVKTN